MTTTNTTTTPSKPIAAHQLERSPLNARRTARSDGLGELKASILAHGLMQNLVVTDAGDGSYRVIAGGRRLEAIRALQREGQLPDDYAVPCQIVTEDQAPELSLAENTVRLAMHPADQFEAFAALIERGQTAAEVAARFGVDESVVHRRMKLARVAPPLLADYRADALSLECLMAFTITDDQRRQLKVYKSLPDWQKGDPTSIRDALTEKMLEASGKLARFVGLEAYQAAGGTSRADLFGEEVYLEKPALLQKLAQQKLAGIRQELEAEGWGWIEIAPERDYTLIHRCTRIRPQLIDAPAELLAFKERLDAEAEGIERNLDESESEEWIEEQRTVRKRLDEVDEALAAFIGFDREQKALAGCFVSLDAEGQVFLDQGLVKPEHRKRMAQLLKGGDATDNAAETKRRGDLPESLRRDLAVERMAIAQREIAQHPDLAFDLLAFRAASELLGEDPLPDGPDVLFRSRTQPGVPLQPNEALLAKRDSLPDGWCKPKSEAARFEAFRTLPESDKSAWLAHGVAATLRPKLAPAPGGDRTAYDVA